MDRRKFIISSACFAALGRGEYAAPTKVSGHPRSVSLRVDPSKTLGTIAPDFVGLGYEISSVARPGLLSARNSTYIQYVNSLGTSGVVRVGGNTSDYSRYSKDGPSVSSPKATVVNEAMIAGPDVAVHTDWLAQFASDEGTDLRLLTHHYYAEGPPKSGASTIENLALCRNPNNSSINEGFRGEDFSVRSGG